MHESGAGFRQCQRFAVQFRVRNNTDDVSSRRAGNLRRPPPGAGGKFPDCLVRSNMEGVAHGKSEFSKRLYIFSHVLSAVAASLEPGQNLAGRVFTKRLNSAFRIPII